MVSQAGERLAQFVKPRRGGAGMVYTGSQRRALATGALVAERLAPRGARVAGLFGTAEQARIQLEAASHMRPFERVMVFSTDTREAARCAVTLGAVFGLDGEVMTDAAAFFGQCDFVVGDGGGALQPDWIHAGLHLTVVNTEVNTVANGVANGVQEIAADVLACADFVAADRAIGEAVALNDMIGGSVAGRHSEADVTICCLSGEGQVPVSPDVVKIMDDMG